MPPFGVLSELRARLQHIEHQAEKLADEGMPYSMEKPLAYVRETLALAERLHVVTEPAAVDVKTVAQRLAHIRTCGYGDRCC